MNHVAVAPIRRALLSAIVVLATSSLLAARASQAMPVIEAGRDGEVRALFAPYVLGGEIRPGWRLGDVGINVNTITLVLLGPEGRRAALELRYRDPDGAAGSTTIQSTKSFAILADDALHVEGAAASVAALIEAIRKNDAGHFWRVDRGPPASPASQTQPLIGTARAAGDGIAVFALLVLTLIWLLYGPLRPPRDIGLPLLGVVLGGALLRLALSPRVALGPWFGRVHEEAERVYYGPVLSTIVRALGEPIYQSDIVAWTNFAYAVVTPAALFGLAMALFQRPGWSLTAAALLALLPQHVRFSFSEVASIPTLPIGCIAFTLVIVALRAGRPFRRFASLGAAVACLWLLLPLRPVNILFVPLMMLLPWSVEGARERWHSFLIAGVLFVAGICFGLPPLIEEYTPDLESALRADSLLEGIRAQLSPQYNSFLNLRITPPVYLLFGVLGGVLLWRRGGRRQLAYLVVWLALFFVAHVSVLDVQMQPRYHLHLVVPFVLLAAVAASEMGRARRGLAVVVAGAVILSLPFHLPFVSDTDYSEMHEWRFVQTVRQIVPTTCAVIEPRGLSLAMPPRFDRAGQQAILDGRTSRFVSLPVDAQTVAAAGGEAAWLASLQRHDCLYFYEGLDCWLARQSATRVSALCENLRHSVNPTPLTSVTFAPRTYDQNLALEGENAPQTVTLTLYRVWDRRQAPAAEPARVIERQWPASFTWALLLLGFGWLAVRVLMMFFVDDLSRQMAVAILIGPLLFLALTTLLTVPASFHDHNNDVVRCDCAVAPACHEDPRAPGWMPPAFHAYGPLLRLLPYRLATLGWVSVALTALSLLLFGWFISELALLQKGSRLRPYWVGWAGFILALHPVFLRVAGAASFWPYAMCCLYGAAATLLVAARVHNRTGLWAAGGLFALALSSNLVMLALLPLALLAPLIWWGWSRPGRHALLALIVVAAFTAPYFLTAFEYAFQSSSRYAWDGTWLPARLFQEMVFAARPAFLDFTLTALPLALLLVLSFFLTLQAARLLLPVLAALALLLGPLHATSGDAIGPAYPTGLVHLFPTLYLQALLAAYAAAWLTARVRASLRILLSLALAAAIIVATPLAREGMLALAQGRVLERELAALSTAFESLPEHDVLVIAPHILPLIEGAQPGPDPLEAGFPIEEYRYVTRRRGLAPAEVIDTDAFLARRHQLTGKRILVYVGSTLLSFLASEIRAEVVPASLERPLLADLKRRCRLSSVYEFSVATQQHPAINARLAADRREAVTLGFYSADCAGTNLERK